MLRRARTGTAAGGVGKTDAGAPGLLLALCSEHSQPRSASPLSGGVTRAESRGTLALGKQDIRRPGGVSFGAGWGVSTAEEAAGTEGSSSLCLQTEMTQAGCWAPGVNPHCRSCGPSCKGGLALVRPSSASPSCFAAAARVLDCAGAVSILQGRGESSLCSGACALPPPPQRSGHCKASALPPGLFPAPKHNHPWGTAQHRGSEGKEGIHMGRAVLLFPAPAVGAGLSQP